jgi:hypothetical protein
MPHYGPSRQPRRSTESGGYLPLALGVSIVRYPISERIFDYVSMVRSATAETLHTSGLSRFAAEVLRAAAVRFHPGSEDLSAGKGG